MWKSSVYRVRRVFRATDRLAAFPRLGRVVPAIDRDDMRDVIVQSYRVIYRLLPDVELAHVEAETSMPYITSLEQKGLHQGAVRVLTRRFGSLPAWVEERLAQASHDQERASKTA